VWILWQCTLNWLLPRYFGHPYGILNALIPNYQSHLDKKLHMMMMMMMMMMNFLVDGLEKLSHLIKKQGVQKQEKTLGDTI
jgi:hypothetical protein